MASLDIDHNLALRLEQRLIERYGLLLSSRALARELAYPSEQAYRQALTRGTMPIRTFSLPQRRGRYALATDLARWIASQYNEGSEADVADVGKPARTPTRAQPTHAVSEETDMP